MRLNHSLAVGGLGVSVAAVIIVSCISFGVSKGGVSKGSRTLMQWMPLSLWTRSISDVSYGQYPENRLDIMLPRWPGSGLLPAVMVFHGGAWQRGSRSEMRERVCRRYLSHGFLTVNIEYRHGISLASKDAIRAVEWFYGSAVRFRADPRRIVVTGESAGAQLALLAAFQSRATVAAVINFYGIADLSSMLGTALVRDALLDQDPETAIGLSPIAQVHAGLPPVLSLHGSADSTVPPDQSLRLTARLRQAGGDAEMMLIPSAGHGFSHSQLEAAYAAVFDFLRRRRVLMT
jgi:acetyl esterase/lipase